MSWQLPPRPPEREKRSVWDGINPEPFSDAFTITACCVLDTLTCCWFPLAGLGLLVIGAAWLLN